MLAGSLAKVGWNKGETIAEGCMGRWAGDRLDGGRKKQTVENEGGLSVYVCIYACMHVLFDRNDLSLLKPMTMLI